jgi:hypothetical protein
MATSTKRRSNRRPPKHTQEERTAQWQALADRLAEWSGCTCEAPPRTPDGDHEDGCEVDVAMVAAALAMHDGYSPRNAALIASQDDKATDVRGWRMWQEVGRQVAEYPEDEQAITIVSFRGEAKGEAQAEAAPAPAGATPAATPAEGGAEGGDKKPSLRFSLAAVHDIRRTIPLFCAECGRPIHRTGSDGRFPVWGHTGLPADLGHKARKPRRGEDAPPPPAGSLEAAQAWHAARSAKAGNPSAAALDAAAEAMAAGDGEEG